MKHLRLALLLCFLTTLLTNCKSSLSHADIYPTSKPCTRWWWFATEIKKEDVRHQLDWLKDNNFGGVEIAWVYPLHRYKDMYARKFNRFYNVGTTAQKWLSPEWQEVVVFTKKYADSIGLTCDFTMGSAWPSAGSNITKESGTQIYGDTSFRQWLTFAWGWPENEMVINHLDSQAFYRFAQPITKALSPALKGSKSALFTDSWEIKLNAKNKIWTSGFDSMFLERFGYDIIPYMEAHLDSFPDVRYDYMLLLDELVSQGFYQPYVQRCRDVGAWSRVQCLASPTDVMTTYSLVDIPETEALLNNPSYSRIVSSAAALAGKKTVSSESFTCMYGFSSTYLRKENTADLKLLADALFAKGVNQHFYHGMPFNPKGSDSIDFFATTYIGPGSSLSEELPAFNEYIARVSAYMKQGKTYSDVAVYIPYEDGVMQGAYPPEQQRVWVWGAYELRYIEPPRETEGYHPLWINRHFLEEATYNDGKLYVGDAIFSSLYVDVQYMDIRALKRILFLARLGLPVCLKQIPVQPGKSKSQSFEGMIQELRVLPNVSANFEETVAHKPLVEGVELPDYWCRKMDDGSILLFLAQPLAKTVAYPMYSGQSFMTRPDSVELTLNFNGHAIKKTFEFNPYQSLMVKIKANGKLIYENIEFVPKDPVIRPRELQKTFF